jgi:hypothetical protein
MWLGAEGVIGPNVGFSAPAGPHLIQAEYPQPQYGDTRSHTQ